MEKISKNCKVKILDSRTFWNNKEGVVLTTIENIDNVNQQIRVRVDLGNNKNVIETFLLSDLELLEDSTNLTSECLNETLDNDAEKSTTVKYEDMISPYLLISDFDDKEIESWFFANRIAIAENLDLSEVIAIAKKLKYPVFKVKTQLKEILIIGSKKTTAKIIEDEYGRFLLGYIRTERI